MVGTHRVQIEMCRFGCGIELIAMMPRDLFILQVQILRILQRDDRKQEVNDQNIYDRIIQQSRNGA